MVGDLKLSTSTQCIKYLMFIFNLLFVITGIILLSIGSVIQGIYAGYEHFLDDKFFSVPALLIATGTIIFFIAFFGCCGAVRENYCMIITFTTLMALVFILEFSAGISGYVLRSSVSEVLNRKMLDSMKSYNTSAEIKSVWDELQKTFECCGTNEPKDWANITSMPMSCCSTNSACNTTGTWYSQGCMPKLAQFIERHAAELGGAGFGIAFVQALGIWFAVYLAKSIKRNYENM